MKEAFNWDNGPAMFQLSFTIFHVKPDHHTADDLPRGKTLHLANPNRWSHTAERPEIDTSKLKKSVVAIDVPTGNEYRTWTELVNATAQ